MCDPYDSSNAAGHVSAETWPSTGALCALSDDALEKELATHAAHIAAAECRFCLMVAEVDRRGFWATQGAQSCAHWLSWRCGVSPSVAREHVRVGRALGQLPRVTQAFATGRLSYSKVRAITRIATPVFEETLVEMANDATAAQLETIVRAFRRASPDEGTTALERHRRRHLSSYRDDDGMVVIQARLSPEDGAAVLAAIEAAREALEQPDEPFAASQADALVALCEAARAEGTHAATSYGPHASVVVHVDEQVLADPAAQGCARVEGVGVVSAHTVQRLVCDARVSVLRYRPDGTVVPEGRTRQTPPSLRRAVLTRDQGCRWPGCQRHRYVDVHHVTYVSKGGKTRLTNLVALCRSHHRLVHEGGYVLTMDRHCTVRVAGPGGAEIPVRPHRPIARWSDLERAHERDGLHVDDATMPVGGERYDLGFTIDVLLAAAAD
jgi:uncharacterized protein (DUF2267 family)